MYCSACGKPNSNEAKYCSNCGSAFYMASMSPKINIQSDRSANPPPIVLIIITWFLVVISFFPLGGVSILIGIAIVICAIFLLVSKNSTAKINGWIVLGLWIGTFLIGFFNEFAKRF